MKGGAGRSKARLAPSMGTSELCLFHPAVLRESSQCWPGSICDLSARPLSEPLITLLESSPRVMLAVRRRRVSREQAVAEEKALPHPGSRVWSHSVNMSERCGQPHIGHFEPPYPPGVGAQLTPLHCSFLICTRRASLPAGGPL